MAKRAQITDDRKLPPNTELDAKVWSGDYLNKRVHKKLSQIAEC